MDIGELLGKRFGRLVVIGSYKPGYNPGGATKRTYSSIVCVCDYGSGEKRYGLQITDH